MGLKSDMNEGDEAPSKGTQGSKGLEVWSGPLVCAEMLIPITGGGERKAERLRVSR